VSYEPVVKSRIQAKLEFYLPNATDSVLCDYVMVMVGNQKTSEQIAQDLDAFLGPDEAKEFVTWLWELLTSVEKKTIVLTDEEKKLSQAAAENSKAEETNTSRARSRSRSRDNSRERDRNIYSETVATFSRSHRSRDRSRSRSRSRNRDRQRDQGDRRRDDYRGEGYDRRNFRGQISSRLLRDAVKTASQQDEETSRRRGAYGSRSRVSDVRDDDESRKESTAENDPMIGRFRSDAILDERKKSQGRAGVQALPLSALAADDLRNILVKNRKSNQASKNVSSEVSKPQEEGEEEGPKESSEKVEFNVTLPDEALKDKSENIDVEDLGEGYQPYEEYDAYEEYPPYEYYPYDPRRGMRSRGRPRGAYAYRGRGGFYPREISKPRGMGAARARGGARGRGGTFTAKKWVNPAKEGQAAKSEENGEAAGTEGNPSSADAASSQPVKVTRANAPVIGVLNLDGDLSLVEKHGMYKAAKWVKPGLKTPEGKQQST